ncbi:copper/zinc superoxide dismutase (SODC) domain-containing protein [Penicillium manginii]|uniref:copper/zinc superoxide dismutase (SODC) domain-containing protein n=1 Tax=Penicillium manginii TaxID=203109 RepID=UPI002547533F|nr:copper/zinc superoxide dismutase (SODC) domain-containing protein [Penicillium manginii]KAJ5749433.1 copper/zinc superoxide dismutase (SODC) domain-containing protein [Penicillium manginii]
MSGYRIFNTHIDNIKQYVSLRIVVCVLRGDAYIGGTIIFEQEPELAPTKISYNITGNQPNAERGLHIHTFGDNTNGCTSAGPHFNPFNKTHGAPTDVARHVGDMGNVRTDGNGVASGTMIDHMIRLMGPHSVIGRTVVIHDGTDDLGKGGHEQSLQTGNAGGRPACGIIGISVN